VLARSLIGALLAFLGLAPVAFGARALRTRWMPELGGPPAHLADIVLGLGMVIAVGEALGTVGGFALVPLTFALAILGLAALRVGRRGSDAGDRVPTAAALVPRPAGATRLWGSAVIVSIAVLTAEWMSRVVDSWNRGMLTVDTLWYHLPIAARFAQTGWTSRLVHVDARSLIEFYPSTSELLHAIGIVFLGNDTLSLVLNLAFVALTLVLDDAGSGLNDVVGIAFFLAAIALVSNAMRPEASTRERRAEMICGALAGGLAVGTKYTLVMPVAVLGIGVIALTPRGERLRGGAKWFGVVSAAGGYWYLRNFATVGNPLPQARLGIGPWHLPSIPFRGATSIAHYMTSGEAWSTYLFPGLRGAFGPAWWGIAAAAIAGIVAGFLLAGDKTIRALSFVSLGCLVAYLFTPGLWGGRLPSLFEPNARYMAPFLVVGSIALAVALSRRSTRVLSALLLAYFLVIAGTQLAGTVWRHDRSGYAQITGGSMPVIVGLAFGIAVAGIAFAWPHVTTARLRLAARPRAFAAVAAVTIIALVGAGLTAEQYGLRHRYRNAQPLPSIYKWAQDVHDARIAVVGFQLQYPLYGKDLSNRVQYVAQRPDSGKAEPIADCRSWRRAINDGRYEYVVATSHSFPFIAGAPALEAGWTRSDPAARLLLVDTVQGSHAWLFEIRGRMNADGCAGRS